MGKVITVTSLCTQESAGSFYTQTLRSTDNVGFSPFRLVPGVRGLYPTPSQMLYLDPRVLRQTGGYGNRGSQRVLLVSQVTDN